MSLNGSLDDYSPDGALRVLSSTGKTGAVRFSGEAGCTVYLNRGQLYFARDSYTDHALATALVRPGRLTAEQWSHAIAEAGDLPRVGEVLVQSGVIDPDLLASVALSVVYDPLIRLFREADGQFEFEPDTVHWIGPFRAFNVDAIVDEVRRRVREVDEMSPLVPSIDSWVQANRALPNNAAQVTLLREDWELVTALSGPRTISELATEMGRGRYSTARVVHRLAQAGLVEVTPEHVGPTPEIPDFEHDTSMVALPAEHVVEHHDADNGTHGHSYTDPGFPDQAGEFADPVSEFDGVVGGETWDPAPVADGDTDWTSGGFDGGGFGSPGPGSDTDADALGGWSLPKRQVVVDDPVGAGAIPGLDGIGGFRNAVPTESANGADGELSPNAAWLENLYNQYMDEPEEPTKKRKKEAIDVAFSAEVQDDVAKTGTLRRLMDALKKL